MAHCDKVLSLDKSNLKALMRRSRGHEALGNFRLAIDDVNQFLQIFQSDPDDSEYAR